MLQTLPQTTTDNVQLDKLMKNRLENYGYLGTFGRSDAPKHTKPGDCFIFNIEDHPGEHWLAYIHSKDTKHIYIYDSFGRANKTFHLPKSYKQSEKTPEQGIEEQNCGARCVSWLMTCDKYTPDKVYKYI